MKRKILVLIFSLIFFPLSAAQAKTIEFRSNTDSYNESFGRWARISGSFGQMPGEDAYGAFVNVRFRHEKGERNGTAQKKLFFTPAEGQLEAADGNLYYVSPSGEKSLVAEKGFLGWDQKENVRFDIRIKREPGRIRVLVEMDIE